MKRLISIAIILLLSSSTVLAQSFCNGDHDYDGDCDSDDISSFLADFGRSQFNNPCPLDGPAPVPKTGQKDCFDESGSFRACTDTGEDGEYQSGVEWPNPRFTDNGDETVTDTLTGLMWLKEANCMEMSYPDFDIDDIAQDGAVTWQHALDFVAGINDGTYNLCGAGYTDWKLPNVNELKSIIDRSRYNRALPYGHPFTNVSIGYAYWSSTSYVHFRTQAWFVSMYAGSVGTDFKAEGNYVWPVRGGH